MLAPLLGVWGDMAVVPPPPATAYENKRVSVNKHLYGEQLMGEDLITTRKHQAKPPSPAPPIERVFNLGTTQVSPASGACHHWSARE